MSKELAKTYDPKGIEERLYKKRLFPCKSKPGQETVYYCYAAAKRNRSASHGTCAG